MSGWRAEPSILAERRCAQFGNYSYKHARGEPVPPSLGGVVAPLRERASNCADPATICADGRTCYGVAVLKLCARRMRSGMHKVLGPRTRALLHCWREMFDRHA